MKDTLYTHLGENQESNFLTINLQFFLFETNIQILIIISFFSQKGTEMLLKCVKAGENIHSVMNILDAIRVSILFSNLMFFSKFRSSEELNNLHLDFFP